MDKLLHIRVGKQLKKELQKLVDSGLFTNQAEVVREAVRDLLIKYKDQTKKDENNK